jgi:hypothetical protein
VGNKHAVEGGDFCVEMEIRATFVFSAGEGVGAILQGQESTGFTLVWEWVELFLDDWKF